MRQMMSGAVAALAVVAASAAPAMACGFTPCEQGFAPSTSYYGCATGCNPSWGFERLAEPATQYYAEPTAPTQYYYVNQGPTYTGPGAFAPYPTYQESEVSGWNGYHARPYHYPRYAYHHGYAPRTRYGYMVHHYYYGHPVLRRYY